MEVPLTRPRIHCLFIQDAHREKWPKSICKYFCRNACFQAWHKSLSLVWLRFGYLIMLEKSQSHASVHAKAELMRAVHFGQESQFENVHSGSPALHFVLYAVDSSIQIAWPTIFLLSRSSLLGAQLLNTSENWPLWSAVKCAQHALANYLVNVLWVWKCPAFLPSSFLGGVE